MKHFSVIAVFALLITLTGCSMFGSNTLIMTPTENGTVRVSFKGKMPQLVKFYYTTDGTPATTDSSDPIDPNYTEGYAELPIVGKWDFDLNVCAVSSNNKTITASQRIEMDICQVDYNSDIENPLIIPKGKGVFYEQNAGGAAVLGEKEFYFKTEDKCSVTLDYKVFGFDYSVQLWSGGKPVTFDYNNTKTVKLEAETPFTAKTTWNRYINSSSSSNVGNFTITTK